MRAASERQDYEDAARLRNRLGAVRHLAQRQAVDTGSGSYDVVAVASAGATANVQLFPVRSGRLDERRSFTFDNADGVSAGRPDRVVPRLVLRRPGRHPAADRRQRPGRGRRRAGGLPRRAPRRQRRDPRAPSGARSAACSTWRARNAELALRHDALAAERTRARRARRSRSCARPRHRGAAAAHRVLRHLEPGRDERRGLDGRLRGRRAPPLGLPLVHDPARGRAGRLPLDRRGRQPPLRAPAAGRGGRLGPQLRVRPRTSS